MSLAAKYTKLRKSIGGNREKMDYEETFGMPKEEQNHVTMPNQWNHRILGELEYALTITKEQNGKYDSILEEALDFLLGKIREQGVLTNQDCAAAEELLSPMEAAAKEYELILAAHSHIDMNWMWGWQETVAAALATFRTMLHMMKEYPDFCFSQSQASVYKLVEDYDPELMEEIKARIQEGRWEITATGWVETDKNMPNTESLLRHIKYTRDYLQKHWGIDPASLEIDFSPDTFGHSANIPEIDAYGGVKYYYHCRGLDGDHALYRWRAPSGQEVLVYREQHWYNGAITPNIAAGMVDIARRSGGLKTGLVIYGVGDHGGGPTRRDVERAIEMQQWRIYPRIRFGTIREFFQIAETVRENLPVVEQELNYFAPGCYTTQSRLKLGNRKSEKALTEAEAFSSLAHAFLKRPYHAEQFEHAWQNVLFSHFHDILTGSCVQESREHAMGLFSDAMAVANTQHSNALRVLGEKIDTSSIQVDDEIADSQSEGAGVGYGLSHYTGVPNPERGCGLTRIFHIFNPIAHARTETVELTVWDWPGDLRDLNVTDSDGKPLEFALLDKELEQYWDHKYVRVLVGVTVPALGYTTLVLSQKECEEYRHYFNHSVRTSHPNEDFLLENEFVSARFDYKNGSLLSLVDKSSGKELVATGQKAGLHFIRTEAATSNAWQIGRYTEIIPIEQTTRIYPVEYGVLRKGFVVEQKIAHSTVKSTVTLDRYAKAVRYEMTVDWNEAGTSEFVPVLAYRFPHAYSAEDYLYDVPAGAQKRKGMYLDVPGLQYGAAVNTDGKSVALVTDCKYGFRGYDGNLSVTLINAATSPDPYPERGIHSIVLFVGAEDACPKALEEFAVGLNCPLQYLPTNQHSGDWGMEKSMLSFESGTAVLSCVTTADDGGLLVRYYEACGKDTEISVTLDGAVKSAALTNLMGDEAGTASIQGTTVTAKVSANHIGAVKIHLA